MENYKMYKAKKKIKKIVSYAKFKVHADLCNELRIREGEKFSSSQEYGKEELVKVNNIKEMWGEYLNKLLNEDTIGGLGTREDTLLAGHRMC